MVRVLPGFEQKPHGQPLHDFDVVAGGVFRRQKADAIAAYAGHTLDVAAMISGEGIDVNGDQFAPMHAGQLRLLEVGDHPDGVGLSDKHQGLPGLYMRAKLHRPLADYAVGRGVDLCVTEVQERLIEGSLCSLRVGLARRDRLPRRARGLLGGIDFRRIDSGDGYVLIILLQGRHLLSEQDAVAPGVSLGLEIRGLRLPNLRQSDGVILFG